MTTLTVTLPETVDVQQLEQGIVTAVADRLRDDHGYELAGASASASGTANEYPLHPTGSIVVDKKPAALSVTLQGVKVDAGDLFTGCAASWSSGMKGFAPRSADWLVLRREADSRAPIRTEPIYPGGFAFSDSKAEPKRRKTGQCSSTGSWFCWDESSSYYCLCWSSTLNRCTASVVDGLIQEVNASESDAHGSR